jgi:hypothetical protein
MRLDEIERMACLVTGGSYGKDSPTTQLAAFVLQSMPVVRAAVAQRNAVSMCITNGPELIEAEKKYHRAMVAVEKAVDEMRRKW